MMLSLMSHVQSDLPVQMCKQLVNDMQDARAACLSGPMMVTTLSSHSGVGSSILILVPVSFRNSRMISPPCQRVAKSLAYASGSVDSRDQLPCQLCFQSVIQDIAICM